MRNTFYLLRSMFGSRRTTRRRRRPPAPQRTLGHFERLEPRQLLAAQPLASLEGTVAEAGALVEVSLDLSEADQSVVLSIVVESDGESTLDPLAPQIVDSQGGAVAPLSSADDKNGTTSGIAVVELTKGEYTVSVGGEGNTFGDFVLNVFVAGDAGNDGAVGMGELQWTTAAFMQQQGWGNQFSQRLVRNTGIDPHVNLYHETLDANRNGVIDLFDYTLVTRNGAIALTAPGQQPRGVTIELTGDEQPPDIEARVAEQSDTGRFNDDGITNDTDMKIVGNINDASQITGFSAQVDGSAAADLSELLAQDFNLNGDFELDLDQLASIAGVSRADLTDGQQHTLSLTAVDELGKQTQTPVEVVFVIDTTTPDAPTELNLTVESDRGSSDSDNVTNINTPTFTVEAESKALVRLYSDQLTESIGQETAASQVTITASQLDDGVHQITATATDLAGNESDPTSVLTVTIDTIAPDAPDFDLDAASDSGDDHDYLTTITSVLFTGTSEVDAKISVEDSAATATAGGTGSFTVGTVDLSFGSADYSLTATDLAGNSSEKATKSFTRNNAPTVENQQFGVNENSSRNALVGTVAADDGDPSENDSLTYGTIGGTGRNVFTVGAADGKIRVNDPAALDFETGAKSFTLTLKVTDAGGDGQGGKGLSDTATITINVADVNEASMVSLENPITTLPENTVTTSSVKVADITVDDDALGNNILSLSGADESSFAIVDGAQGKELHLAAGVQLNFEGTKKSYSVTVEVDDDGTPGAPDHSTTFTLSVSDVNEAPTAVSLTPSPANIDENTDTTNSVKVADIAITDDDLGDNQLTLNGADADSFVIVNGTGGKELHIKANEALDHESQASYAVTVRVNDSDVGVDPDASTAFTLNVNDVNERPTVSLTDTTTSLREDTSTTGSVRVADIEIADDELGTNKLSLSGDDADMFRFVDNAGGTELHIKAGEVLDYETNGTLNVTVRVDDADVGTTPDHTAPLSIAITDVNERPVAEDQEFSVQPDTGDNVIVDTIEATDPEGQSLTFSLDGVTGGTAGGRGTFEVSESGQITAKDTSQLADEEQYDLTVSVSDGTTTPVQITVTVQVRINHAPTLAEIGTQTVLRGSPLHIPLNGVDEDGDPLTFTVETIVGDVGSSLPEEGKRSMRIVMKPFGDPAEGGEMIIKLFEERAGGITEKIIAREAAGVYDDNNADGNNEDDYNQIFHRVWDTFMIQWGDPDGNGKNNEGQELFDDVFHPELQHNRADMVSTAKVFKDDPAFNALDDTNSGQMFILEDAKRRLDYHHSVFGIVVKGSDVRDRISSVPVDADTKRPLTPVVVDDVEIFPDMENEVMMLKAGDTTGATATVRVTVEDGKGGSDFEDITVNVSNDTHNSFPFLGGILDAQGNTLDSLTTPANTPLQFQLTATDVERDDFVFFAAGLPADGSLGTARLSDPIDGNTEKVVTYTPPGTPGTYYLLVGVQPAQWLPEHNLIMWNADADTDGDGQPDGAIEYNRGRDFQWLEIVVT